jgi:hypothetical protein
MQNINYLRKRIQIVKYLFLLAGAFIMICILISYFNNDNSVIKPTAKLGNANKLAKEFSLSINNPIFEGTSKENFPYKITAKTVNKQNNNIYNLSSINADYKIAHGNLEIVADSGVLDEETKSFSLSNNVKVLFNGLMLISEKIDFDLNSNAVSSNLPVEVNFKNSQIKATSFNCENEGTIINFEGDVVSTFDLDDF